MVSRKKTGVKPHDGTLNYKNNNTLFSDVLCKEVFIGCVCVESNTNVYD
jgi:hypothetical protein